MTDINKNTLIMYKGIFLVVAYLILFFVINNDSQIYFYSSFIYYSLGASVLVCLLIFYISNVGKSLWYMYCLAVASVVISSSLWFVPKILHYTVLEKDTVCLKSTIIRKYWHRPGDVGHIGFRIDQNITIPQELISFNSLSGLSEYVYDTFPPKGSNILICGDMSRIGYTYSTQYSIGAL